MPAVVDTEELALRQPANMPLWAASVQGPRVHASRAMPFLIIWLAVLECGGGRAVLLEERQTLRGHDDAADGEEALLHP